MAGGRLDVLAEADWERVLCSGLPGVGQPQFTCHELKEVYLFKKVFFYQSAVREGTGNPLQYSCLGKSMDRGLAGYSPWGHRETRLSRHTAVVDIQCCVSFGCVAK